MFNKLMQAACDNDLERIKSLAHMGFNFNEQDDDGNTALTWAAMNENVEAIKLLIYLGANPEIKNNLGANLSTFNK